jgi:general secretion pathway protein C
MLTTAPARWSVRGATFALWLLAAASAAYWVLKVGGPAAPVASAAPPARAAPAVDPAAIARLLGSVAPLAVAGQEVRQPSLASRFVLVGVVAGVRSGGGAAVIAVDGKPARPYRVGSAIEEGLVLQSVQGRRAVIGQQRSGPALLTLELPPVPR